MRVRLAPSWACVAVAITGLLPACASSEGTTTQENESGVDSTSPQDAIGEGSNSVDSGTGTDGAGADAKAGADATVTDTGVGDGAAPDASADVGAQDATVMDVSTADTGGQDATLDTGPESAADSGGGDAITDASADTAADAVEQDAAAEVGTDAGADTGVDAGTDTGADAGNEAGQDSGVGGGPACRASDGGIYWCNAGQHCCANAATYVSSCATACDPTAGTYPVDCAGQTGDAGCGSGTCCGTVVISGGTIPPMCTASQLTAACTASACNDNPPGDCTQQPYTIRLCLSASECSSDPNGNTYCCSFNGSPVSWCVGFVTSLLGTCM